MVGFCGYGVMRLCGYEVIRFWGYEVVFAFRLLRGRPVCLPYDIPMRPVGGGRTHGSAPTEAKNAKTV